MPDLRDNIWQFVGVIVAVVTFALTLALTLLVELRRRRRKALGWFVASRLLVSADAQIQDEIQILYKGRAVRNLRYTDFGIVNTGNVAIASSDFEGPLSLDFGASATLISTEVILAKPEGLSISILPPSDPHGTTGKTVGGIRPLMLNPGETVILRFLVNDSLEATPRLRALGAAVVPMKVPGTYVAGTEVRIQL